MNLTLSNLEIQEQVDEAIFTAERDQIKKLADRHKINLDEFNFSLQLIQNSCSKDSIAVELFIFYHLLEK